MTIHRGRCHTTAHRGWLPLPLRTLGGLHVPRRPKLDSSTSPRPPEHLHIIWSGFASVSSRTRVRRTPADPQCQSRQCQYTSRRYSLFQSVHNLSHPGTKATVKLVAQRFVWPGIQKDCRTWARACEACQRCKVYRHNTGPRAQEQTTSAPLLVQEPPPCSQISVPGWPCINDMLVP
jgi:hypothetical protein